MRKRMRNCSETRNHILETAKQEFLEKGFQASSLRNIVKRAGVTTGAFYGYYKSKEELFDDLVREAAEGLFEWYEKLHRDYMGKSTEEQKGNMRSITDQYIPAMITYIYRHFDAFKLILCCGAGTKYENFMDRLVAVEEDSSKEFVKNLKEGGYSLRTEPDSTLIHILCSTYFKALYEMVAHNVPEEKALQYMRDLSNFQYAGWFGMLGL